MGVIPDQFQKGPKWERAYKPTILRADLGTDTVASVGTGFENYGVTTIVIPKPLFPVNITVWAQSWSLSVIGTAVDGFMRIAISTDNGVSFSFGPPLNLTMNAAASVFRATYSPHHLVSGLPTNDIVVKAQIAQNGGAPGQVTWFDGSLLVQVTPLP